MHFGRTAVLCRTYSQHKISNIMVAVKVQYTVQPGYVGENKQYIQKVMEALRSNPIEGMQYSTYTDDADPQTFIHINMARDEETLSRINNVPAFQAFRSALKASEPVSPPQQTKLQLVAAGFEL